MKNIYPTIVFSAKKKYDKEFFKHFSKPDWAIRPELQFLLHKDFRNTREKFLFAYVDNYFTIYEKRIADNVKQVRLRWESVSKYFYSEVALMFKGFPWPKGNYRAYSSIWRMYPRDIRKKTFAFPAEDNRTDFAMKVIAHEMLHFITYDYLEKKYKLRPSEVSSKENIFWQFTENLNVLIENQRKWARFTKNRRSKSYPECKKLYLAMERIWDSNNDIDNLILKTLIRK